jgi:hypothetical protein
MAATEKISVTIGRTELGDAKRLADHLGLSLSGFITEALKERIQEQARRDAAQEVLATFAPEERATAAEASALLARWAAGGVKARGRKAAQPKVTPGSLKRRRKSP